MEEALERVPELVESSLYATNLREWQNRFPPEQLSINLFEDLSSNPQAFIDRLADFLEIPRFQLEQSQLEQVYSTAKMTEPRNFLATRLATAVADWCKARKLDHVVAGVKNSQFIRLFLGGGAPFPDVPLEALKNVRTQMLREIEDLEAILGRDLSHWKTPPSLP